MTPLITMAPTQSFSLLWTNGHDGEKLKSWQQLWLSSNVKPLLTSAGNQKNNKN